MSDVKRSPTEQYFLSKTTSVDKLSLPTVFSRRLKMSLERVFIKVSKFLLLRDENRFAINGSFVKIVDKPSRCINFDAGTLFK